MQIWWSVLVGGLAMSLAGCGTAPVTDDDFPRWSNGVVGAVPATRDVRITLESDGTTFSVGESVTLYYRIENLRRAPLFIIRSGDYRLTRQKRFEVSATRIDGMAVSDPFFGRSGLGASFGAIEALRRGKPWYECAVLPAYCQITEPGTYVIRMFYDAGWGDRLGENDPRDVSITLTFVDPTPAQRQTVVDSIPETVTWMGVTGVRDPMPKFFPLLRDPAYLPELERRAMAGSAGAVISISNIATAEATATLFRLAEAASGEVADRAWLCLGRRCPIIFPEDESYYASSVGWWLELPNFGNAVLDLWPPETIAAVRDHARDVLRKGKGRAVAMAAGLVARLSDRDDLALLVAAFDRELERDGGKYLETAWMVEGEPVKPIQLLLWGCFTMIWRGATLSESARTPAEQRVADYIARMRPEMR